MLLSSLLLSIIAVCLSSTDVSPQSPEEPTPGHQQSPARRTHIDISSVPVARSLRYDQGAKGIDVGDSKEWFPFFNPETRQQLLSNTQIDVRPDLMQTLLDYDAAHPFDATSSPLIYHFYNEQMVLNFALNTDFDLNQIPEFTNLSKPLTLESITNLQMKLPHSDPGRISMFDIIENKLLSRKFVQEMPDVSPLSFMQRPFYITKPEWESGQFDNNTLQQIIIDMNKGAKQYILKPTHLAQSTGFVKLSNYLDLNTDVLNCFIAMGLNQKARTAAYVPSQTAGVVIEEQYVNDAEVQHLDQKPIECRLFIVWGKFYYGVIKTPFSSEPVVITRDRRFFYDIGSMHFDRVVQYKRILDKYLSNEVWPEMIKLAEVMTRNIGCYGLRVDCFIGSSKYGFRWNEFAFPNELDYPESFGADVLTQRRRDMIQHGFALLRQIQLNL